jgi:hypothetical protein
MGHRISDSAVCLIAKFALHDGALIGCKTDGEDAQLLIVTGRKRIRSEPSALNELNNEHNDGNHEQKMNQSAAKVADKAQKPEHD